MGKRMEKEVEVHNNEDETAYILHAER